MKCKLSRRYVGIFLIVVSVVYFGVSEHYIRRINKTWGDFGVGHLSLEASIIIYFLCVLVFVTGIFLCLRSSK